jgi:metal-responsive CopG/Arc/MetJ family transcriptional regulator
MIQSGDAAMSASKRKKSGLNSGSAQRASISFPPELYRTLEVIAKKKRVSLAWVVRDAAEKYLADQKPLAKGQ